jgi:hypothetical protein
MALDLNVTPIEKTRALLAAHCAGQARLAQSNEAPDTFVLTGLYESISTDNGVVESRPLILPFTHLSRSDKITIKGMVSLRNAQLRREYSGR